MFVWDKVNFKVNPCDINYQSKQAVKGTKLILRKMIQIQSKNYESLQMEQSIAAPSYNIIKPITKTRLKEELISLLAPSEGLPRINMNKLSKNECALPMTKLEKCRRKPKSIFKRNSCDKSVIRKAIWLNKGNNNKNMYDVFFNSKNNDLNCSTIDYTQQPLTKGSRSQKNINKPIYPRHYFLNYTPLTRKLKLNRSQLVNVNTTFDLSQFLNKSIK